VTNPIVMVAINRLTVVQGRKAWWLNHTILIQLLNSIYIWRT